jgi:hypothetical protein
MSQNIPLALDLLFKAERIVFTREYIALSIDSFLKPYRFGLIIACFLGD